MIGPRFTGSAGRLARIERVSANVTLLTSLSMKNLKVLFLTVFLILFASHAFAQRDFAGRVVEVVDGKTVVIELTGGGRLTASLQYIEVPEADQPLYGTVREHLGRLVLDKKVIFHGQGVSTGTVIVGELMLGDVDVSQQMLRDGAAWHISREVSGQSTLPAAGYEQNQAMAKADKIGVWSVPGLKPAWEHRAEKEEALKKQREAEAAAKAAAAKPEPTPVVTAKKRYSIEDQLKANAKLDLWPEVDAGKRDPSTGIVRNYDPAKKVGITETGTATFMMTGPKGDQRRIQVSTFYIYFGPEGNTATGSYGIGFVSESKDAVLQKTMPLFLTIDGKRVTIKPLQLITEKKGDKNSELLLFKLEEDVMQNVAYADKLEIKLGTFAPVAINDETRNMMRHLMLARK